MAPKRETAPMISKPQIITAAACHTCGAMRGEPCTFNRAEDPSGLRYAAQQSHVARNNLARKNVEEAEKVLASIAITI